MRIRRPILRPALLAAVFGITSLLSCGEEVTGPGAAGRQAEIALHPVFGTFRSAGGGADVSIGSLVDFTKVRVVLVRAQGDTAVNRLVDFPPDSSSVSLAVTVTLAQSTQADGEPFSATLDYINAAGSIVFRGGPVTVIGKPTGSAPVTPPEIPVTYAGPGANAASIVIAPKTVGTTSNQPVAFSAVVRDQAAQVLPNTPVAFSSTDTTLVRVDLRTGAGTAVGVRGTAQVIAQTLTGQADTATVAIAPTPSAVSIVSGNNQSVRQGSPFPLPMRVRVTAADALPVAGVPVTFTVTRGLGTRAPAVDTTDAQGIAEAVWTAGDSVGVGTLTATVPGTALSAVFSGTQLSAGPTALTFETSPGAIAAGAALPSLRVVVRDAIADTVRAYVGPVTLALSGGTVGASLLGTSTVNAVAGVATFTGLTVDRAGTAYRLSATVAGVPAVQSSAFDVTPSLPAALQLLSGAGQSVPPGAPLPDSIVVRVVDVLASPKAGVTVNFAVTGGGGSISPASATSDANGRVAVRWTAGAVGAQELTVTSGGVPPLVVSATAVATGGPPVLFLSTDFFSVGVGRQRAATLYLTNPAPSPLTVRLVMRDTTARWSVDSLVIPSGASSATATITGLASGTTWAVATSSAGNDSLSVTVDSLTATIARSYFGLAALVSDTIRTVVRLSEPAPAGGLQVTVRSTDSSAVLVAPGTGLGAQEDPCGDCFPSIVEGALVEGTLVAPPSGTATMTVPAGQSTAHLVIVAVGVSQPGAELQVTAPGYAASSAPVSAAAATLNSLCYNGCEVGPGQGGFAEISIAVPLRRELRVRVRSLDPAIATVRDSIALVPLGSTFAAATAIGQAAGNARIVLDAPGFEPDTVTLTVSAGLLRVQTPAQFVRVGQIFKAWVSAALIESFGQRFIVERTMTALSRDTSVVALGSSASQARVNEDGAEFELQAKAPGSTWVVFGMEGYATDSMQILVGRDPMVVYGQAGVGLGMRSTLSLYLGYEGSGNTTAVASSADSLVVRVLQPSGMPVHGDLSWSFEVEGRALGTTIIRAGVAGVDSASATISVGVPELGFYTFSFAQTIAADSTPIDVQGFVSFNGFTQYAAQRTELRLRSTNPSVLRVTDSVMVLTPDLPFTTAGTVRAVGPGTAQLVLEGAGFVSDTSAEVTVLAPALEFFSNESTIGTGTGLALALLRRGPAAAALPVSLVARGPSGLTLAKTVDTIPAGETQLNVVARGGESVGVDTIIASAPGYAPDTFVIAVGRSEIDFYLPPTVGAGEPYPVVGYLAGPTGYRAPGFPFRFRVVSRDTAVVRVEQDSIEFLDAQSYISSRPALIRGVGPGGTWIVASDPTGVSASDSAFVNTTTPRFYTSYSFNYGLTLPMQSRSYPEQVFVFRDWARPTPVWTRITSSAPSIVSVPDSVLVPAGEAYAPFDLTTGDTTGSATVTMSAPGYVSATFPVYVTRGRVVAEAWDDITTSNQTLVEAYNTTNLYTAYPSRVNVPLRFSVLDTTRAQVTPDTGTLVANVNGPASFRLRGVRAGGTVMRVEDARTSGFARLTPSEQPIEVLQAALRFYGYDGSRRVPVGMRLLNSPYLYSVNVNDSVWVRVRSLHGRSRVQGDSVLMSAYSQEVGFPFEGLVAGVDTLVAEAPGYRPDSITVAVGIGLLKIASAPPSTITVGDSVLVRIDLRTDADDPVVAVAPHVLTLTTPAVLQARVGGVTVNAVTVPAGAEFATFWLRAASVGSGNLTITAAGFAPATYSFTTRAP